MPTRVVKQAARCRAEFEEQVTSRDARSRRRDATLNHTDATLDGDIRRRRPYDRELAKPWALSEWSHRLSPSTQHGDDYLAVLPLRS